MHDWFETSIAEHSSCQYYRKTPTLIAAQLKMASRKISALPVHD